jgi:hypothetical protein
MRHDRLLHFLRYFQFENNENLVDGLSPDYGGLWNLRNTIEQLSNISFTLYLQTENLVKYEVIVKFKGRVEFQQYTPKKQKGFGVNLNRLYGSKRYNITFYVECSCKCHPNTWKCVLAHKKIAVCQTQVVHKLLYFII